MYKKMLFSAFVLMGMVSIACAQDAVVAGKMIKMDYTLFVNNEQLETSVGKTPLEFVAGDQSIIPGLEKGIEGMKVGEEKTIVVEPKDAYGESDPKALKEFPKDKMPGGAELKVGMVLEAQSPDGETFPATISDIKGDQIVMDFNHPLAGKQLTFKVKILDVTDAPAPVAAVAQTTAPEVKGKE
jgi:FKBP-type peptidyl-prolyl cis-trans isomerase 2